MVDIYIGRRSCVKYAYNQRWGLNIERFLDDPDYWIEEGEKQYKEFCERRRIKKSKKQEYNDDNRN